MDFGKILSKGSLGPMERSNTMEWFSRTLNRLNGIIEIIAAIMLALMVIIIFLQVIFRSLIKSAIPWSEELARYLMVWISFLGSSIAVKRKGHIGVGLLLEVLPDNIRKWVLLSADILMVIFFATVSILGLRILNTVKTQVSPAMELSMAIPYSAVFAGGTLMLLYSIYNLLKDTGFAGEGK